MNTFKHTMEAECEEQVISTNLNNVYIYSPLFLFYKV